MSHGMRENYGVSFSKKTLNCAFCRGFKDKISSLSINSYFFKMMRIKVIGVNQREGTK